MAPPRGCSGREALGVTWEERGLPDVVEPKVEHHHPLTACQEENRRLYPGPDFLSNLIPSVRGPNPLHLRGSKDPNSDIWGTEIVIPAQWQQRGPMRKTCAT